jgi:hypothetical protein
MAFRKLLKHTEQVIKNIVYHHADPQTFDDCLLRISELVRNSEPIDLYWVICLRPYLNEHGGYHGDELLFFLLSEGVVPDRLCIEKCMEGDDMHLLEELLKYYVREEQGELVIKVGHPMKVSIVEVCRGFDIYPKMQFGSYLLNPIDYFFLCYRGRYCETTKYLIQTIKSIQNSNSPPPDMERLLDIEGDPWVDAILLLEIYEFYQGNQSSNQ